MVNIYVDLILKGLKTINDVPEILKEQVISVLFVMDENFNAVEESENSQESIA